MKLETLASPAREPAKPSSGSSGPSGPGSSLQSLLSQLVVDLLLIRVAQHLVGFANFLEALFSCRPLVVGILASVSGLGHIVMLTLSGCAASAAFR